MPITTCLWWF